MWKSINQRGIQEELKKSRGINVEFKVKLRKKRGHKRSKEFQSENQKTSNKLKQKNKNLGCLVEKMSQVLRWIIDQAESR
jgi:hypothetical protein